MGSASKPDWPAATVRYRLNLPHELHAISPAISALHIARAAAVHPEISSFLQPTHCPKCGTYRYSGDHSLSLVGSSTKKRKRRSATSSHEKAPQRRCRLCGFSIDVRTSASFSSQFALPSDPPRMGTPNTPRAKETGQDPPPSDVFHSTSETVLTTQHVPTPPLKLPARRSHTQSRHTSSSTLKDLLSRDRQREEAVKSQRKKKEGREGLAAFLREL